ncbi:MAG: thiamine pyrophosphate-dependent enzyme [Bullifex sp.]
MHSDTDILKGMYLSRFFEEKLQDLFSKGELYGTTHLNIGQEASHFGLCLALDEKDWIVPTHRTHGFNIAKGSSVYRMFSEMLGSRHGLCGGLGGSMHMTDTSTCNAGSSAVVGSGVAIATGLAFALRRQKSNYIAVAIMGDGATSRGVVHECMNLASVWNLPVMFYCENNHYGMSASAERMISTSDISSRAAGYSMKAFTCDGNDFDAVYDTVRKARSYMTSHSEPVFVEVSTYRFCGHSKSDKLLYRNEEEEAFWRERDPILRYERKLSLDKNTLRSMRKSVRDYVESEWKKAYEDKDDILTLEETEKLVTSHSLVTEVRKSGMHPSTYRLAIREALSELLGDERTTLIGEDVGLYGGCFGVTGPLYEDYPDKILETPVSEEAFTGLAAGAGILGERVIVEIMYGDFLTLSSDALINHAAKLRYMSAGQLSCPMVLRTPIGSGTGHGSQHTQSLESMFLNIPGLKVVAPSDPFTAKALLKSAWADPDPVLFLEHKALYGSSGECGDAFSSFPIGKAQLLSEGDELTLISYSRATLTSRRAVSEAGRRVDHIDLLSLRPIDFETIRKSVVKTGKVILVEDPSFAGSVMATIAGMIASDPECFESLRRPVEVISGADTPIPFSRELESAVVPQSDKLRKVLEAFS